MESSRSQDSVPTPSPGRGSEVGPGLRKVRPLESSRKFEELDLESAKSNKTFSYPKEVAIPAGYSATDFEVPHTLGSIPTDMIIGSKSANVDVWKGTKDWTRKAIYLRSGTAVTVVLYLVP